MQRVSKNMPMELTSEYCEHESSVFGRVVKKRYQKVRYNGELQCPMCESERMTQEFEKEEGDRLNLARDLEKYFVLNKQSLLKDHTLLDATFKNYEAASESEEEMNKARAVKAVQQYRDGKAFNTLLFGNPGVGKSHLAMSIIRNLNETDGKKRTCLFMDLDEMLSRVRDSFSNRESKYTEQYFIRLLSEVDYLVLDDLGAETGSTDTQKTASDYTIRILKSIADARQGKSTIFTTNLGREALTKMYDQKTVSRLLRDTYLIKFEKSSDKRIKNIEF